MNEIKILKEIKKLWEKIQFGRTYLPSKIDLGGNKIENIESKWIELFDIDENFKEIDELLNSINF